MPSLMLVRLAVSEQLRQADTQKDRIVLCMLVYVHYKKRASKKSVGKDSPLEGDESSIIGVTG